MTDLPDACAVCGQPLYEVDITGCPHTDDDFGGWENDNCLDLLLWERQARAPHPPSPARRTPTPHPTTNNPRKNVRRAHHNPHT